MVIHLSPAARAAVARDLGPDERLRIAFAGGCGALGFRLAATRRGDPEDLALDLGGFILLLDHLAARELDGATLDFDDDEGFRLDHLRWGVSC